MNRGTSRLIKTGGALDRFYTYGRGDLCAWQVGKTNGGRGGVLVTDDRQSIRPKACEKRRYTPSRELGLQPLPSNLRNGRRLEKDQESYRPLLFVHQ